MRPTHLLDGGVCADFLSGRSPQVEVRVLTAPPDSVCTSAIVAGRLRSAASKRDLAHLDAFFDEIPALAFGAEAATIFGELRAELDPYDRLIASQALALDCILVTDRPERFRGVAGLEVEDWREPPAD